METDEDMKKIFPSNSVTALYRREKHTNNFMYTTTNTGYPKKNICKIPKNVALRLKRIWDDDEIFDK